MQCSSFSQGTLLALADSMGFIDEDGDFPKSRMAFSADAIATMFGALFGLSPVTSFIESGAGVEMGARTGLCAIICGFFFLISIFFSPILASIPPWASGGSLVIVGAMMCRSLNKIKWHNLTHALSAFVTVMLMPLTYSIAYGLIGGMFVYLIMEGTFFLLSLVGISKPEFEDTYQEEDGAVEYTEGATKKELEDGEEVEEVAAKEADTVKKDEEEGPIDTEG